jgi:hypothetical protein
MGKTKAKLAIRRETLRRLDALSADALAKVAGGAESETLLYGYTVGCKVQKDPNNNLQTTRGSLDANRYC